MRETNIFLTEFAKGRGMQRFSRQHTPTEKILNVLRNDYFKKI